MKVKRAWRRVLWGCLGLAVVALGSHAVWLSFGNVHGQTVAGQITPYTAILQETVIDGSGGQRPGYLLTQALRSDGSEMRRLGVPSTGGRTILFASGVKVEVSDELGAKSTVPIRADVATRLRRGESQCIRDATGRAVTMWEEEVAGEETIDGYRAVKVTARKAPVTQWFALDHGCALLRSIMTFRGGQGSSEMHLLTLVPGEPEARLFLVPESYKEGPPSALAPPVKSPCPADCQEQRRNRFVAMDKEYHEMRSRFAR